MTRSSGVAIWYCHNDQRRLLLLLMIRNDRVNPVPEREISRIGDHPERLPEYASDAFSDRTQETSLTLYYTHAAGSRRQIFARNVMCAP
tara:strand:+ start:3737 stop:4003 length:267 start_codon:yes stop_codon:yes gene_type:complete